MTIRILQGDCLDLLRTLPNCSVDSIVTDPPYGLGKAPDALAMLRDWLDTGHHDVKGSGFMGKKWDAFVPQSDVWRECLRVLKPGGHLLAFAGTRTQDLMALGLRIAGFEIRDLIAWVYGSGFPKSMDVSKAIDKAAGHWRGKAGAALGDDELRAFGQHYECTPKGDAVTAAAAAAAAAAGWGTALKPALEPITLARKPLAGTVAVNVMAHGTGALNIDGCRVSHDEDCRLLAPSQANIENPSEKHRQAGRREAVLELKPEGRWPANLIHDGSEEVLACFPDAPGQQGDVSGDEPSEPLGKNTYGVMSERKAFKARRDGEVSADRHYTDAGATNFAALPGERRQATSAARFFYCAKASKEDREVGCEGLPTKTGGMTSNTSGQHITRRDGGEPGARANHHPTVKPTDLMRYLVRLVTPKGGTVLDPYAGSGSTGRAADIEGFDAILMELDPEYIAIARRRIHGDAPLFANLEGDAA